MNKKYKIIAIIGEAGSGKDTILNKVVEAMPSLNPIISHTTRPPREGEVNGVNYFFVSGEQFGTMALQDEFLEMNSFNNWFYGTSYSSLRSDGVNIGVFNPEGIDMMMADPSVDLYVFYINVKEKTRMLRQLNREEDPDVYEIVRRFQTDCFDFEDLQFHYNELANETYEDLDFAIQVITSAAKNLEAKK